MSKQTFLDISKDALLFLEEQRSLVISSIDESDSPLASYAPYYRNSNGDFYLFVSTLSNHTSNLLNKPVSIMIVQDENSCRQIYARKRIIFQCSGEEVIQKKQDILTQLKKRHGEIINTLSSLSDFKLIKLTPKSGRLVLGFGQAYDVDSTLTDIVPIVPKKPAGTNN